MLLKALAKEQKPGVDIDSLLNLETLPMPDLETIGETIERKFLIQPIDGSMPY